MVIVWSKMEREPRWYLWVCWLPSLSLSHYFLFDSFSTNFSDAWESEQAALEKYYEVFCCATPDLLCAATRVLVVPRRNSYAWGNNSLNQHLAIAWLGVTVRVVVQRMAETRMQLQRRTQRQRTGSRRGTRSTWGAEVKKEMDKVVELSHVNGHKTKETNGG